MNLRKFCGVALAVTFSVTVPSLTAHAQVRQDMKAAGHATKDAAVDTGHATAAAGRHTAHGVKHVAHKTHRGLHKAKRKVEGKPTN